MLEIVSSRHQNQISIINSGFLATKSLIKSQSFRFEPEILDSTLSLSQTLYPKPRDARLREQVGQTQGGVQERVGLPWRHFN